MHLLNCLLLKLYKHSRGSHCFPKPNPSAFFFCASFFWELHRGRELTRSLEDMVLRRMMLVRASRDLFLLHQMWPDPTWCLFAGQLLGGASKPLNRGGPVCRSVYTRPVSILSCPHSLKFRGAALMWITEHLRGGGVALLLLYQRYLYFVSCWLVIVILAKMH